MTREEMLVLADLKRLCLEAPAFALGFPDGTLPVADEYAFGFRLLDVAHGVLRHARERVELDGSVITDVDGTTDGLRRQISSGQASDVLNAYDEPECLED